MTLLLQIATELLQIATAFWYYKLRQQLLQIATAFVITNCDRFITNCDSYYKLRQVYYKLRQVLQIATIITNWDSTRHFEKRANRVALGTRLGISPRFRLHSQGPSIAKESRLGTRLLLVARPVVMLLGIGIPVAIKYHLLEQTIILSLI